MINYYVKAVMMKERLLEALKKEDGLGTVEIAIIIIILVGIAFLFKGTIVSYVDALLKKINDTQKNW